MWASQKENTDKRKYVILKYKYVGKKTLEDSNEKRTIRGQYLEDSNQKVIIQKVTDGREQNRKSR